jgi:hypothetical protein
VKSKVTYSVKRHKSPEKNAHFLVEWDNIQRLRQIGSICINDVLEVLGESCVQGIKVHSAVDYSQQTEEFVRSKVFDDLLLELCIHVLTLDGTTLDHKVLKHFVQRYVPTSNQKVEVVEAWRLVLNED